jgi:hypothetical protein
LYFSQLWTFQVFVSEPEMELRTPYDAIDNIDVMQPDKQFLESLKDAMRSIATGSFLFFSHSDNKLILTHKK